jgi:dihydroflavonol-4-reductase
MLLDSGLRVRALHRPGSNRKNLQDHPVDYFQGDILDRERMVEACEGVRWVFHAASESAYWRNPQAVRNTAIEGTRNVAEAAMEAGVERMLFTSSIIAMGLPEKGELLTEDHKFNLPEKRFPYGAAKYQSERVLLELVEQGLDAVIVNPTLILGPGDLNAITGSMVIEAGRGWGFLYLDGGANYVHIDDVARGHLAAIKVGERGKRYILGGENLPHHQAFSILTKVVGRRPPWLKIPGWIVPPAAWLIDQLSGLVRLPFNADQLRMSAHYIYCDIEPARADLGLTAPLPFEQAVEDTYQWYLDEGMLE